MSCGKWLVVTCDRIKKYGSNPVIFSEFVNNDHLEKREKEISAMNSETKFVNIDYRDAHHIFTKRGLDFKKEYILSFLKMSHAEMFDEIVRVGNPEIQNGIFLSETVITQSENVHTFFTYDEIKVLRNHPVMHNVQTLAHLVANNRYLFSLEELMDMGYLRDILGFPVEHYMIRNGHNFSINELKVLFARQSENNGNTTTNLVHEMITYNNYMFSMEDIENLENIVNKSNGFTIAHVMANKGHNFSESEIRRLGNPKTKRGETIKDIMNRIKKEKGQNY